MLTDDRSFGRGGILVWTLSFTEFNVDTDKKIKLDNGSEVWICDYKEPAPLPPNPDETTDLSAVISGGDVLRFGIPDVYSVTFNQDNIEYVWNIVSDFPVKQNINGNEIELTIDSPDYIGSSFILQIIVNDEIKTEKEIRIAGLF